MHFDFLTSGNPNWSIKGENNCENDYSDYCSREKAFQNKNLKIAKYDYYDYTGDEEKTDGNFDINNDILTPDQEERYRQLEIQSKQNGCTKYLGYMSFHNNFLEDNKIIDNGVLNSQKLKKVVRSAMSELLNTSKKLDIENTYWTAAIHINTDNVHAHITLLEKEKRERKNDCIEQYAIEAFKSKVVNTIAGSERSQLITEISRNVLLPGIHNELGKVNFNELISQLPERHELWFYNRREFKPYKKYVDDCVNKIIEDTPGLKEEFDGFIQQLDRFTDSYKKNYGEGKQELYKEYKKNKLQDFYSRAGNSVLKELKNFSENSCVLSEKESGIFEEMETSEIILTKIDTMDNSEQFCSADNKKNFLDDSCVLSEKENSLAQYTLGKMYLTGEAVDQDKTMALKYLTASAEQNNGYAQYALGNFFLSDREHINIEKALYWLKKSADENNNQYAQYTLGKFYTKNKEYKDIELGKSYLQKSAGQGNENAQKYLGRLGSIRSRRRYLQEQRKQQKAFYDYTLQKIVNQLEGHLEKLKNEFNSEEDSKLAQQQHELEIQIKNERSW